MRRLANDKQLGFRVQFGDGLGKVILAIKKISPAIWTNACAVYIVRIPRPDRVQAFWLEV